MDYLEDLVKLSNNSISNIVYYWWFSFGNNILKEQLCLLRQTTGEVLRVDHTYYCTSTIGIHSNNMWKSLKSSLLVCMNENAYILNYKIVPNDTREFMESMIYDIVKTPNRKVFTKALYTDNARADSNIVSGMFKELFPDRPFTILQVY